MWNIHLICNLLKFGNNIPADICRLPVQFQQNIGVQHNQMSFLPYCFIFIPCNHVFPQLFKAFTIILLYRTFVRSATQNFMRRSFSLDTHCSASCFPVCLLRNTKQGKRLFPRTRSSATTQSQTKGSSPGQIESLLSSLPNQTL